MNGRVDCDLAPESSSAIHTEQLDSGVTSLAWLECGESTDLKIEGEVGAGAKQNWEFLARLPSLSKTYSYSSAGEDAGSEEVEQLD